jgi:hypothetical protein
MSESNVFIGRAFRSADNTAATAQEVAPGAFEYRLLLALETLSPFTASRLAENIPSPAQQKVNQRIHREWKALDAGLESVQRLLPENEKTGR